MPAPSFSSFVRGLELSIGLLFAGTALAAPSNSASTAADRLELAAVQFSIDNAPFLPPPRHGIGA